MLWMLQISVILRGLCLTYIRMYLFSQVFEKMSNTQFSIQYLLNAGENSYVRPLTQKSPLLSK